MKFQKLSIYLVELEKNSSRLKLTEILADLINKTDEKEIEPTINLLLGQLAPAYKSIIFNIANQMMLQAISQAYDTDLDEVKSLYKQKGDLGIVAESLNKNKSSNLTISEVYQKLLGIAEYEGEGSVEQKILGMANLLKKLDAKSSRFVARIPIGKLRLGFSDKTIIDALSWGISGDKNHSKEINAAYEVYPDIGFIVKKVKKDGLKSLENIKPQIGVPVMPQLAARLKSPTEMIAKMGKVSIEPKFDGLRVLIHFEKNKPVQAFTRNLNNISEMFPELQKLSEVNKANSAILDSEAVGLDPKTKKMVDFQATMKRRRKYEIADSAKSTPIRFQLFDLIFLDNKNLMQEPYLKRREILEKLIKNTSTFRVDEKLITDDPDVITKKHKEYLNQGLEGVIVKKIDADYVPGRTGWRWVKMKEVESAHGKLADTVDAVIMGYSRGRGKRAQFGLGQFLAGVKHNEEFLTITKVGTGLTENQLTDLAKKLDKLVVETKPKNYKAHKDLEPDFWVEPKIVVELAADEITVSPKHTANLALRFPRLISLRSDKNPGQATTLSELKSLHKLQKS